MRYSTAILSSILTALVSASCSYEGGNYFCSEVSAITYSNVGYSGSYSDVIHMDENTCKCTQKSVSFSGSNSPLDEELSVHFRGPVKLLQFGAYYPSSSSSPKVKRDANADADCKEVKHVHHAHKREAAVEVVEVTQTVYVDSNGDLITSSGVATTTLADDEAATAAFSQTTTLLKPSEPANEASSPVAAPSPSEKDSTTASSVAESKTSSSAAASPTGEAPSGGAWTRNSYYTPGSTDNVVFLNTQGGVTESGIWSSCFGNSLSYAAANGVDASSSAVALGEVTLGSDEEYVIFTGSSCDEGDDGCGYYRTDIPAYHGFGGSEKIFVFEFEMPHDYSSGGASNPDMPAIWLLNAKIPRTLQYGDASCSCWSTGCGELDLFEILAKGDERLISHIHDGQGKDGTQRGGGGSQDYFARPTSSSLKAAVIFSADKTIKLVALDDSTNFGSSLSESTVQSWLSVPGSTAALA